MNLLSALLGFKANPVEILIQLVMSVGESKLKSEVQKAMNKRITPAARGPLADKFADLSAAVRSGDNAKAADIVVSLLETIR